MGRPAHEEVTLVFTDLVGFSQWALRAGDDAMLRLLRWVAQVVEPPLLEAGGQVVKRMGDGIMAVFHDPVSAITAVRTAREALKNVEVHGYTPTSRDGSLVNLNDGLVGVVFLVCLARVVFAGGVNRPRDVSATRAFADDDENVVHLTLLSALVGLWAEPRDRVDDDGVRGGFPCPAPPARSGLCCTQHGVRSQGSPAWCGSV